MILIISRSNDISTFKVINHLEALNVSYFLSLPEVPIRVRIFPDSDSGLNIAFHCTRRRMNFLLSDITAVWYRRGFLSLESINFEYDVEIPLDINGSVKKELAVLTKFIYDKIEELPSIGKFSNNAINKLSALQSAKDHGLSIPKTIVTNRKEDVRSFYNTCQGRVITKPLHEGVVAFEGNMAIRSLTATVDLDLISSLPPIFNYSLFQEKVSKTIEVRVFNIECDFYAMAIFSQQSDKTATDFRNYQQLDPIKYVPYKLPQEVVNSLKGFVIESDYSGGSADFAVTESGDHYFFEYNPVGQFGMTSYPCNYNLEKKIALRLKHYEEN